MATQTELVTIDRVAAHLNWSAAQTSANQTEMADLISAVTAVVEDVTGPVVIRDFNEWQDGGSWQIRLDNNPVQAITLVSEAWGANTVYTLTEQPLDGSGGNAYGYTIDKPSGRLIRMSVGQRVNFAFGKGNINIQYSAGYCVDTASVPAAIRQAALEVIRFNWQPQQTGNWPAGGSAGVDAEDVSGAWQMGYFVPARVMGMLKPYSARVGIA